MNEAERELIVDFEKCDFTKVFEYYKKKAFEKKILSAQEKQQQRNESIKMIEEHTYCICDGRKYRIPCYQVDSIGLFRGRGLHPRMGKLKKRIMPEDVVINCGKYEFSSFLV